MSLVLVQEENTTSTRTVSLTSRLSILQHTAQTNSINWHFKQLEQSTILDKFNLQLFQMVPTGDEWSLAEQRGSCLADMTWLCTVFKSCSAVGENYVDLIISYWLLLTSLFSFSTNKKLFCQFLKHFLKAEIKLVAESYRDIPFPFFKDNHYLFLHEPFKTLPA